MSVTVLGAYQVFFFSLANPIIWRVLEGHLYTVLGNMGNPILDEAW